MGAAKDYRDQKGIVRFEAVIKKIDAGLLYRIELWTLRVIKVAGEAQPLD